MWRLTRAWPWVFVLLLVASACGGGSPTSPSTIVAVKDCQLPSRGAMTATLDGTPWIPVSTRATLSSNLGLTLAASDCTYQLSIRIRVFKGLGTYDVAAGVVEVDHRCDGRVCGAWNAGNVGLFEPDIRGSGSVTVTACAPPTAGVDPSGAIEGTFAFTLVGATGTRVMTNGRFGSNFWGAPF